MNTRRTPSLTGLADLTTRRTSLLTLGGAALATLSGHAPETVARKNKAKKKAKKRCQKQGNACRDFATRLCALHHVPGPLRQSCENRANACCSSIEQCNGGEYFTCLFEHLEALEPV